MNDRNLAVSPIGVLVRRSVEATVIRACEFCHAPGRYLSLPEWSGYPGIAVKAGDPRDGQPVGDVCPNCGARRTPDEPLGEISVKDYRDGSIPG